MMPPVTSGPDREGHTGRLLVVDDDEHLVDIVVRRLSRRGYTVESATNAAEALGRLGSGTYDLVLLDQNMPDVTGIELLQLLRGTYSSSELPVVMLTAQSDSDHVVRALEAGANDYLTKPLDFSVALARIRTQLLRKHAEEALRESEERYALATRGSNDGIWDWNLIDGHTYYSHRWKEILGYLPEEIGTGPGEWLDRIHAKDRAAVDEALDAHRRGKTAQFESEHRLQHKDGTWRWVLCRGQAVRSAAGAPLRMAGSMTDVTESKVTDPLTGVATRLRFTDRLARTIQRFQREPERGYAVLFLDIDRFKYVNDTFGHLVGDALLQQVARRLGEAVSDNLVARLGGDEFAILVEDPHPQEAALEIAGKIEEALDCPMTVAGRDMFVTVSIGVSTGCAAVTAPGEILRDADTALYRAKKLGRARTELFDEAMRKEHLARLELESELRRALLRREIEVAYQPLVALDSGRLLGVEALVRWRHTERGLIPTDEFISLAEDTGLIVSIGAWVLAEASRQAAEWTSRFPAARDLQLSVNLSARQLQDPGLVATVGRTLSETGLRAERLCLEITESILLTRPEVMSQVLGQLKALGVRIEIDDFGTGYSSLSYLSKFPVDGLKIDRSFTGQMGEAGKQVEIVRSIIALADVLQLYVVAEGIESEAQNRLLRSLGCSLGQGFYYARPMPATGIEKLIEDGRASLRPAFPGQ